MHAARVGGHLVPQHAQQGRLAATVRSDDDQPVSAVQSEVEAIEQRLPAVALRELRHLAELVGGAHSAVDARHDGVDLARRLLLADVREPAGEGPARVPGRLAPVPEGLGLEGQQLFLVPELPLELAGLPPLAAHELDEPAVVLVEPVVLDLDDPVDRAVQEVPVVRDHESGAPEPGEPALEPRQPVEVEEVRGLVEQQDVRRLEQDLGQRRPVAPSSGEVIDGHRPVPIAETQPA